MVIILNQIENKANKAITIDGGKTWSLVADGQNPSYKSCVQYVPNTNGKEIFAVGKTGISFSNDGGKVGKKFLKIHIIQFSLLIKILRGYLVIKK